MFKIVDSEKYRRLTIEREMLIDVIDAVLTNFASLDRNKSIMDVTNNYEFWNSVGRMKGMMYVCGVIDRDNKWIEP